MKLFIDTWGWLALRDEGETRHKDVRDFYHRFRNKNGNVYTSDYVLDETITLLFKRLSFAIADDSLEKMENAIEKGYLRMEWITPERFESAKIMRRRYQGPCCRRPWLAHRSACRGSDHCGSQIAAIN